MNPANHVAGVPMDYASFHFYASASSRTDASTYTSFFSEADSFITEVAAVIALRDKLNPGVTLDVDECGVVRR